MLLITGFKVTVFSYSDLLGISFYWIIQLLQKYSTNIKIIIIPYNTLKVLN